MRHSTIGGDLGMHGLPLQAGSNDTDALGLTISPGAAVASKVMIYPLVGLGFCLALSPVAGLEQAVRGIRASVHRRAGRRIGWAQNRVRE